MDKQDFQEQDFMEILVRLPCTPTDSSDISESSTLTAFSDDELSLIRA